MNTMKNIIYNQYRLLNLQAHDFSYKLVEIDLPIVNGQEKMNRQNLDKVAFKLAAHTHGPVASIRRNGKNYLAVPANKDFAPLQLQVVPFTVNIRLLPTVHRLHGRDIDHSNYEIPLKFLTAAIKSQLKNKYEFFELNNGGLFFLKKAAFTNDASNIDIHEGFALRLRRFDDRHFYVVINPTFKYFGSTYLPHIINAQSKEFMAERLVGKHCLYQNGDDWYPIEVVGFLNTISQDKFNGETVLNYIRMRTARHQFDTKPLLNPKDLTLLYKYPNRSMTPHQGATSLAKLVYHTKDLEDTSLHSHSILPVDERFDRIDKMVVQYMQGFIFNELPLKIATTPYEERLRFFPIPDLLFNGNKVLSIGNTYADSEKTALRDYPRERKNHIIENKVLKQTGFDAQYLIYPESLDKNLIKAIQHHAESYLKRLAPKFQRFQLVPYKVSGNQSATVQVQEIEKTLRRHNVTSGFGLFLFDDFRQHNNRRMKVFHDCLKKKFFPNLKFQCASSKNLRRFFSSVSDQQKGIVFQPTPKLIDKFKSYLFYLVMEYLKINSKWAYALKDNLHYDIWIGIDVQDRYVGFTFFYKNGENIIFKFQEITKKTGRLRDEKIDANILISMLKKNLEDQIPRFAPNPNSIVVLRDGRIFDDEIEAIDKVISELKMPEKGLITNPDFTWGAIELHKKFALPLRAARRNTAFTGVENPQAGTYRIEGGVEGFLFNTGYPFQNNGTVNPISLLKVYGNINFEKAMKDIFAQCMLAYSAPDRSNNLPITIKLIDTFLEPLSDRIDTGVVDEELIEMHREG